METEPGEVAAREDWPAGGAGAMCPHAGGSLVGGGAVVHVKTQLGLGRTNNDDARVSFSLLRALSCRLTP
uniref:Uncharacterized protein n=1 Tax=Oryza rufipogon TaxID=4529 RepID=A0A0E0QIA7_ORYRU